MTNATAAGIRVVEQLGEGQPIAHAATSITAFVGRVLRGPINQPILVSSFADFSANFGGLWQPSTLSYAIEQYFENGGTAALVVRVANGAKPPTLTLPTDGRPLQLVAQNPGTREFLRAAVDYDGIEPGDSTTYNLTLQRVRAVGLEHIEEQEIYPRVSTMPDSARRVEILLGASLLARALGPAPSERPWPSARGQEAYVACNSDGHDGAALSDYDLIGSASERTGLFALTEADYFNFLYLPPLSRTQSVGPSALLVATRFCRSRHALLLMDPPADWVDPLDALAGAGDLPLRSEDAVMFFPPVLAYDRLRARFESFAPSAAAAGMLSRGAGVIDGIGRGLDLDGALRPGLRPSVIVDEALRERLSCVGINVLQSVRSPKRIPARTMAGLHARTPEQSYLQYRRMTLFLAASVERGTRWSIFHVSEPGLWRRLTEQVSQFFKELQDQGLFGEEASQQSWFVLCDGRLNLREAPMVSLLYGIAARREGQFQAFMVTHSVSQSTVRSVTLNRLHWPEFSAGRFSPENDEHLDRFIHALGIRS